MQSPSSNLFRRRTRNEIWIRWVAASAVAIVLALPLLLRIDHGRDSPRARFIDARTPGSRAVPNFDLRDTAAAGAGQPGSRGAVFSQDPAWTGLFWGTAIGGDSFTGTLISTPFTLAENALYVPIIGYPATPGNALQLEILRDDASVETTLKYNGANPEESPRLWEIDTGIWRGRRARLILHDTLTGSGGWLGIGQPIVSAFPHRRVEWLAARAASYWHFLAATLAVAVCLFLPGWFLRTLRPTSFWAETACLPVPGLLLLAFYGLLLWLTKSASATWPACCFLALNAGLAVVALCKKPAPVSLDTTAAEARALWPLGIWGALVAGVLAVGLNPLPVADEYSAQTTLPGRMVASPPDHLIPYQTAAYFWHGKDGRQDSQTYFGDWSVTSRGPLAPLAITGLFNLFGLRPDDPPGPADARIAWPVTSDGAYLARILGWLTNACVILGAGRLLLTLGADGAGARLGLVWLALAPVTVINTVFLWPKMLATFFLLLATAALLERRWRPAAGWAALAALTHPVGVLFLPPLGMLGAHAVWLAEHERGANWRARAGRSLGALAGFAGLTLLLASPWLFYKLWIGHSDVFMRYPLGDGRGSALAVSIASWAQTRWDNLWYTLMPGAFFASDRMSAWLTGPLTGSMRWIIQYAKSLPGNLGYAGFVLAVMALLKRPRGRPALVWWHLGAGAFALMLLFWGFSSDGLGRNCLEPLSVALLLATAATWSHGHPKLLPLWMGLVGLDSLWVVLGGFASARDFSLSQVDFAAGGWIALNLALTAALLCWSVQVWGDRDRINAAGATRPPPPG